MTKRNMLMTMAFSIGILGTLACSLISGLIDQGTGAISTAQSVATLAGDIATDIGAGGEILATAQAVATEIDAGDLGATAAAIATQVNADEFLATAQAAVTDVDLGDILLTAQAVGTLAAAEGGDPVATAAAIATQLASGVGDAPEDIPIPEGNLANLFTSPNLVSFMTADTYDNILSFYQEEMVANGWSLVDEGTIITPNSAVLIYEKIGFEVTLTISGIDDGNQTVVQILIQPQ